jgi:hypothetical protein
MLKLMRPVTITTPTFLGKLHRAPAHITLSPNAGRQWTWKFSPNANSVPITPEIVDFGSRRIRLIHNGSVFEIFEHLGALRHILLGVDIEATAWNPFFGFAGGYLDYLQNACEPCPDDDIPWYTPSKPVRWEYIAKGNRPPAYTELHPTEERRLTITVYCNYPGLGELERTFAFDTPEDFQKVLLIPTQGWPRRNYWISKTLGSAFQWPYHSHVIWPQEHADEITLERFVAHRAQDILGGLSLLCKDGRIAGHVISRCSGHKADARVAQMAYPNLKRI